MKRSVSETLVREGVSTADERRLWQASAEIARLGRGMPVREGWSDYVEGMAALGLRAVPSDYDQGLGRLAWQARHWDSARDPEAERDWIAMRAAWADVCRTS